MPAVEQDHIPARSLFRRREWPVGYVFPSCAGCNDASAADELAMGFLVRISISDVDSEAEAEIQRALVQLHDRQPNWIAGLKELSRTETRQYLRKRGQSLGDFNGGEIGLVTLPADLQAVPQRYGQKLGRALYYLHTGRIVPSGGAVMATLVTNTEFASFPTEAFSILTSRPVISRSGKSLESQFNYRFGSVIEGGAAAFLVQFGESMAMVIYAFEDSVAYEQRRAERRPASGHGDLKPLSGAA